MLKTPPFQHREHEFDHRLGNKDAFLVAQIKESACSAGDLGSVPGLERSPGERKSYPLQCKMIQPVHPKGNQS